MDAFFQNLSFHKKFRSLLKRQKTPHNTGSCLNRSTIDVFSVSKMLVISVYSHERLWYVESYLVLHHMVSHVKLFYFEVTVLKYTPEYYLFTDLFFKYSEWIMYSSKTVQCLWSPITLPMVVACFIYSTDESPTAYPKKSYLMMTRIRVLWNKHTI